LKFLKIQNPVFESVIGDLNADLNLRVELAFMGAFPLPKPGRISILADILNHGSYKCQL
jgi:hypothetical protein